ncbi:MAG TPA: protein kinase [Rudaea sp.]|jgi:serine/threonine protein kinase/tetratricopeptide (TPR) repeat protein|uniref:protein kinase domain-containing protein n=1 Tax=Rudaea sp. TaxID=2136325 RepID=UPI002F947020
MATAPILPIDRLRNILDGAYTIDRELRRGGMSAVFLAQDRKHQRAVAIKVLNPELAASVGPERFLQEIQLAARLNHPHILGLYDSGSVDGMLYYVMPYVEGESLRERLDREQLMSIEEAVHHGRAIASALDYANRQGVVHRDVKPENVMLYEGEAMVMDFGIAKAMSSVGSETQTQTGMMVGTPAYVSPEQAAGDLNLDGRSDQYSLGCMMYEMLTGERPFSGATPQAVMTKRFTENPRPVRALRATVPESIERAVTKAMATEPGARFTSTGQFGLALASGSLSTPNETAVLPQPSVSTAKSVAVLPFANRSTDEETDAFSDGMAEEIINALTKIQALRVASRTSSFAFKGRNEDIGEIGRKLKVSTVLEGSVRRMGNKLRITAQLVNVADGYHLWSERYDRDMEDVFAIQDDISQAIVKALRVILSDDEKKQIEKVRAVNVEAYDFYLRGRQYFHQHRRKSLDYARQMFNKAIEIDPEYALAYAGVADCYSLLYTYFDSREFNLRQADIASNKALELAPDLAEAHLSRGIAVSLSRNFDEAKREFETAIALDPKHFEAVSWFARMHLSQGNYDEVIRLFDRAIALRPEDYEIPRLQSQALKSLGRNSEAEAANRRSAKLVEQHLELNPDDARALIFGSTAHAVINDPSRAIEYAMRAMAVDPEDPMLLYNVACTYGVLGKVAECLHALEQAVSKGWGDKAWLEHDSDLDSIRSEPRYLALLKAM